jgi:vacuolar-type H+-ATPase subunit I/STV1
MPECDPKLAYNESRAAWTAAKLSSAKEIEELEEYKVMLNSQIDELEAKLDEAVEVLEKYASNEFITWLVATQQGMDCDPNKMARDTLDRLKSNGPITSEGK